MNSIEHIRHSLAHLMAAAITQLYPDAQLTLGPAIEDGFYYDVNFPTQKPKDDDLPAIEAKMREILPTWHGFERLDVTADEARQIFAGNPFKLELIDGIVERGEEITLYKSGDFVDLCRGGHVSDMAADVPSDCFQLNKIAGAYWRGDEKNPMLTRIYGFAFANAEDLKTELWRRDEAEKRDHRKLGKELKLFTVSELVGSGLPLFHPRGLILRQELTNYLWELHRNQGYQWVWTPHLAKEALYEMSGHAGHYMDDMFKVHGGTSKEDFYLKPMNCPHHYQLYADNQFSYRDMPVRYFEPATIYRDEKTGQLSGLARVRSITQDDGHLFVRPNQIHEEFVKIVGIVKDFYTTMGMMEGYWVRLSLRDDKKENYLGSDEIWATAEEALTGVCKDLGLNYKPGPGEAAFYGPKLDFMFKDAIGREWQLATIQCDFNAPNRFDMTYVNEEGKPERPVVIHRAIAGSLERFLGVAIEHFAGAFPVWLSPVQVAVLPISGDKHGEYAETIVTELKKVGVRVDLSRDDTLGKRIRNAKNMKVPYQIVVGDAERDANTVTVEGRNDLKLAGIQLVEFVERISREIKERVLN